RERRMSGAVGREERGPLTARGGAARADTGGEALAHAVGNQEFRVLRPAVAALREADFLGAERLTVRRGRVPLAGGAGADGDGEGRPSLRLPKPAERLLDAIEVVGVAHAQDVPAVSEESRGDVFREGETRLAFDRDVVVVVDPAQVIEGEVTGQRRRFGGHAL